MWGEQVEKRSSEQNQLVQRRKTMPYHASVRAADRATVTVVVAVNIAPPSHAGQTLIDQAC